jgi:hypothetical protein
VRIPPEILPQSVSGDGETHKYINHIRMANTNSATVCYGKACATVHGEAAELVKALVVITAFAMLFAAIGKLLGS